MPKRGLQNDNGVWQPGADRAEVLLRLASGLSLRARAAGVRRDGHGRRLRSRFTQRGSGKRPLHRGNRPRVGQRFHRVPQPVTAGAHRRPANARDVSHRALPPRIRCRAVSEALCQMERGAGVRTGRACGARARLSHRDAGTVRAGIRVDSGVRLGRAARADSAARSQSRACAGPRRAGSPCAGAGRVPQGDDRGGPGGRAVLGR